MNSGLSRRNAIVGLAGMGVGGAALSACGADSGDTGAATDPNTPTATSTTPQVSETGAPPPTEEATTAATAGLASTAEVPVGSGVILTDEQLVITQPSEGDFKAFSAICTHQGCLVASVTETINCRCHNSTFALDNGDPTGGSALVALPAVPIKVDGDQISLA